MAQSTDATNPPPANDAEAREPIPFMQRLLDNPFLLLMLGIVVPTVFYLIWGIMEMVQLPIAQ